jgi:hypothetical protein
MIKPEQIPEEAAGMVCYYLGCKMPEARQALVAAINAWPGFKAAWFLPQGKVYILPAPWENPKPQEKNDD